MALGRYSRVDGRKSSNYCSTVTLVVFVALCLVGVWMMTSSSVVPLQNANISTIQENNINDANDKGQVSDTHDNDLDNASNESKIDNTESSGSSENEGKVKQFEDNPGDLPEDATKGDSNVNSNQEENSSSSHETENSSEVNPQVKKDEGESKAEEGSQTDTGNREDDKGDSEKKSAQSDPEALETNESNASGGGSKGVQKSDSHEKADEKTTDGTKADSQTEEKVDNRNDSGEKKGETTDGTKADSQTEEKVDNRKDSGEKKGETTEGAKADSQILEKTEDMKDSGEKNGKTTDGTKVDSQIEEKVDDRKDSGEKNGTTTDGTKVDSQIEEKVDDRKDSGEKNGKTTVGTKVDSQIEEKVDDRKASGEKNGETTDGTKDDSQIDEKVDDKKDSGEKNVDGLSKDQSSIELFPSGAQSELSHDNTIQNGSFSTQEAESNNQKEVQKSSEPGKQSGIHWKLCNVTAGPDYIPCLDNLEAIKHLRTTKHYEHRERHCPDNPPTCLVSLPEGYQPSIVWPKSREKIWYHNVPHTMLAQVKGHQNWVKLSGEFLTFPGGGTQFKRGALHYIDFIQQSVPEVAWGKRSRVVLDVGCGVASFAGYLFDRDVLTMSLAPKDEHEAQVQFALERGIPAISAVMGTKRLPFPGRAFDIVHCARCRVPWHIEGGKLLLELNRLLRPGGFFVWSATPIYQKLPEDVEIWEAMKKLTKAMCWEVLSITKDRVNSIGIAVYQKPLTNECYEQRSEKEPPLCSESDDPSATWNVLLQACMHKVPAAETERGSKWPELWPARLQKPPYWLLSSQVGVYGKPAPDDFSIDYEHWKRVVNKSYLHGLGINWSTVRNVMDMRATYGGFAAALREMKVWVMNVIPIDAPDTLPIIYERGLFGMYHDWCESHSTYPRSYDLLHADHLFSKIKAKCNFVAFVTEVDRILRPGGKLIVRDRVETINELESMLKSMKWEIRMTYAKDSEGLLCAQKTMWRPKEMETISYAIA